jgi:hypothetical protein
LDPFSRQPLFVEKDQARRERQKAIVVDKPAGRDARSAQPRSKLTGLPR